MKNAKSWMVQLATGTKRKVVEFISDFEFSLDGKNIKTNLNILSLGSFDVINKMDWLEKHKSILDFYEKTLNYKDDYDTTRTTQGIPKLVYVKTSHNNAIQEMHEKGLSSLCHPNNESVRKRR